MVRTVSIRRSLLVNIVGVIVALSATIIVVSAVGSRRAVSRLSASVITRTTEQVRQRLRNFFDPVSGGLQIARSWGREGLLDLDQPERLGAQLSPFIREYHQVSSIIIADGRGREYMLTRVGSGWSSRQLNPGEWGPRARVSQWTDDQPEPVVSWRELEYDPRTRPWYEGAVRRRRELGGLQVRRPELLLHWTEPYTFFSSREPGITASLTFEPDDGHGHDGIDRVVAFDVLLSEISDFTYTLRPSPHGVAFVMTDLGQVIGLPHDHRFADPRARRSAMLRQASELGVPVVQDGTAAYRQQRIEDRGAYRFTSGGESWWAGATSFGLGPDRDLLVAVAMPVSDLLGELTRLRWTMIAITFAVLGAAIWRAAVLARRYSRPIEALVHESRRISRGDLEPGPPVVSGVREVRRLAEAHERMRQGLRTLMKLERDLQLARQIQESTFPEKLPELRGFQIDAWSDPADETGGDTFDVVGYRNGAAGAPIVLTDGRADRAVLLMADATGHGIGPAISVTQVRAMLRMAVRLCAETATIVQHLNDQLREDLPEGRFITVWLGKIDAKARTLTSFSAGQAPILRYEAALGRCSVGSADTLPLGVVKDLDIDIADPLVMNPGDIVAVISDGIFEATDAAGTQFGTERVTEIIVRDHDRSPTEIIANLRAAVERFTGGAPAADDRTGIIIKAT